MMQPGWRGIAKLDVTNPLASGAIVSTGTRFSGAKILVDRGLPVLSLNPTFDAVDLRSDVALVEGVNTIEVSIDANLPSTARLSVNGELAGSVQIDLFPAPGGAETFVGGYAIDEPERANDNGFTVKAFIVEC